MADQFYKAVKRKETSEETKKHDNQGIRLLMNYVAEGSENEFFEKLVDYLNGTFNKQ